MRPMPPRIWMASSETNCSISVEEIFAIAASPSDMVPRSISQAAR